MDLVEVGCSVSRGWTEAVRHGFSSMDVDDVHILVVADFVKTVRELTKNASYATARGGGAVAAKTLTGPNGSTVVLNYPELQSRPLDDIRRVAAHEAGHVLIDRRGDEELKGYRDAGDTEWEWMLKCVGGLAIIELRIERSLIERGYGPGDWAEAVAVDRGMRIVNAEVVDAVTNRANVGNPRRLQDALFFTLGHATKMLAYIAAPLLVGLTEFSTTRLSLAGQEDWADYVAPTWRRRLTFWGQVPSASELIPSDVWRGFLRESALLEGALLRDFGFAFENVHGGGHGFYRRSGDDVFNRRLLRVGR